MTMVQSVVPRADTDMPEPGIWHICCGKDSKIGWCGELIVVLDTDRLATDQDCIVCDGLEFSTFCPISKECNCRDPE